MRQTAVNESRVCINCLLPLTSFHSAKRLTVREDRFTGRLTAGRFYNPEIIKVGCVISYLEETQVDTPGTIAVKCGSRTIIIGGMDTIETQQTKVFRPVAISGPGCPDCQYLYAKAVAAAMAQAEVADVKATQARRIHPMQYAANGIRKPTSVAQALPYTQTVAGVQHQAVREAWIDVSEQISQL